jgi:hypothetical protein
MINQAPTLGIFIIGLLLSLIVGVVLAVGPLQRIFSDGMLRQISRYYRIAVVLGMVIQCILS